MRTTVTLDADTEQLLREEVKRSGKSFKRTLNEAIRQALARPGGPVEVRPLFPAPFPVELDGANFNHLADEWEDRASLEEIESGTDR